MGAVADAVAIESHLADEVLFQSLAEEDQRMSPVHNNRYDLEGIELPRLIKTAIVSKIVPMGNFRGGPGGRCLIVLALLHYFGYPVYRILAQYGHRLQILRHIAGRFRR